MEIKIIPVEILPTSTKPIQITSTPTAIRGIKIFTRPSLISTEPSQDQQTKTSNPARSRPYWHYEFRRMQNSGDAPTQN